MALVYRTVYYLTTTCLQVTVGKHPFENLARPVSLIELF